MAARHAEPAPRLSLTIQLGPGIRTLPLPRHRLRRLAAATVMRDLQVTLRFAGTAEARALNAGYRSRDYATNVLTFAYEGATDIVICVPVVRREAREQRKPFEQHLMHLFVHGLLHAQGHDHETETQARVMEAHERAILARFRIPDPYR